MAQSKQCDVVHVKQGKPNLQYCTWLLDGFEESCRDDKSIRWQQSGLEERDSRLGHLLLFQ